jgi:hypothetical protein
LALTLKRTGAKSVLRKILFFLSIGLLGGCATGYQSHGFSGGYNEISGPGRLEQIVFSGNGFANAKTIQQYALYRCAEVAKEKNKRYFMIFDSLVAASVGKTVAIPPIVVPGSKPVAAAFVLFLDSPRPNAIETEKTLHDLGFVKKNNPQT